MEDIDKAKNACEECARLRRAVLIRSRIIIAGVIFALLFSYPTYLGGSFLLHWIRSSPSRSSFHKAGNSHDKGYDQNAIRLMAYGRHVVKEGTKHSTLDCFFEKVLWAAPGVKTDYVKGDRVNGQIIRPGTADGYGEGVVLIFNRDLKEPSATWHVFNGKVSYSKDISVAEFVEIMSQPADDKSSELSSKEKPSAANK